MKREGEGELGSNYGFQYKCNNGSSASKSSRMFSKYTSSFISVLPASILNQWAAQLRMGNQGSEAGEIIFFPKLRSMVRPGSNFKAGGVSVTLEICLHTAVHWPWRARQCRTAVFFRPGFASLPLPWSKHSQNTSRGESESREAATSHP